MDGSFLTADKVTLELICASQYASAEHYGSDAAPKANPSYSMLAFIPVARFGSIPKSRGLANSVALLLV